MIDIGYGPTAFRHPVLTMGTFDGVHLGHRRLLETCLRIARENHGEAVVVTYLHHPLETLRQPVYPYLLTEKSRKEELLREIGIDSVLYLRFDQVMAAMPPDEFLEKVLLHAVGARDIVVGYDTHFGKDRAGNYDFLLSREEHYGYHTHRVPPLEMDGAVVSSSRIRDLIREGKLASANRLLGRTYSLLGTVEHGEHLGHGLGFPTVNLVPVDSHKLLPPVGVYVTRTRVEDRWWPSVTDVGTSPTVKTGQTLSVESHLLDYSGNLYGVTLELEFHERLRDEQRFDDREQLLAAIRGDIVRTREWFDHA